MGVVVGVCALVWVQVDISVGAWALVCVLVCTVMHVFHCVLVLLWCMCCNVLLLV